jgi:serine/threonine-protein kinase
MGEVWKARDSRLGREVAIKTLPAEFSRDSERLARFEREAQLLASLNHPNIAAIHGFEEDNGTHFLEMEFVPGETLADRAARGAIPIEECLKLALQIAEALEAAHEKAVVHRDLKPANVKITPEGRVKVLDFGLAKAIAPDPENVNLSNSPTLSAATKAGVILGTAAYMSPEQARGETADKRADIWAFGCVLFEMLTGQRAFGGRTVSDILAGVLRADPEWKILPQALHPRIRFLLERCLEKDINHRYHDIADARVDIQKVLADPAGVLVRPVAAAGPAATRAKLPWVAAVVLALIIGGLAVWTLTPAESRPVFRFVDRLPEGRFFRMAGRSVVAVSSDGSKFVYNGNGGLYLRTLDQQEARLIPGTEEPLSNPTFSPDGEWLAYWSQSSRQLKKIPLVGGAAVRLADVASNPIGISWDADETILYAAPEGIMQVNSNGGEPELLVPGLEGVAIQHPQLLRDGNAVLFETINGQIGVRSLGSEEAKILFPGRHPRYVPTGHLVYELDAVLYAVPFDVASLDVTGGPVPMVEGVQYLNYAVSDSGTLVYVPGSVRAVVDNLVLTWVDRNGAMDPLPVPPRPYRQPKLSPDGTRLAVQTTIDGESDIWVYDLAGNTQMRQMTGEGNNMRPIWTPDGKRITFTSDRDGQQRIYWQLADLSGVAEPLTPAEKGFEQVPDSWAPDGKTLSFTKVVGLGEIQSVWTLSLDDGSQTELSVSGATSLNRSGASVFSPDGKWLVYRAMPSQSLFMQPFPATGTELRLTQETGSSPVWSRDGRELFYRRGVNALGASSVEVARGVQAQEFVAVDITLGGTPKWTNERVLPIDGYRVFLRSRDYDVTPDGKRFIMIFPAEQAERSEPAGVRISVVLNWLEELKQRVAVR